MLVDNQRAIVKFVEKHPRSRVPLAEWLEKVKSAKWNNIVEVRSTFNNADYVKPFVVFNVGGNKYRVVAELVFKNQVVRIAKVGTHSDYDGWKL